MILVSTEWKSFVSEKKQKTTNDGFWNSRGIIGEKSNNDLWTMAIFSHTNHILQASAGALLIVLGGFVALLVFHICSTIKEGDFGERKESQIV